MIKIYHIPLVDIFPWVSELRNELCAQERDRASRFVFERDREIYIVCRGFLRRILGSELSCDPKSVLFEYNSRGKPELSYLHGQSIRFNLSHTKGIALIAVAAHRHIGIDIEWRREIDVSVMESSLTKKEMRLIQALSKEKQSDAFLHYWTKKEACLKGLGIGLSGLFTEYDLGDWSNRESILFLPNRWTIIKLEYFDISSQYVAAVAYEGSKLSHIHCNIKSFCSKYIGTQINLSKEILQ